MKGYDIIKCSAELRRLLQKREEEMKINLFILCRDNKIPYRTIKEWLTTTTPIKVNIDQYDIKKFAGVLGIHIKIAITTENREEVRKRLLDNNIKLLK